MILYKKKNKLSVKLISWQTSRAEI